MSSNKKKLNSAQKRARKVEKSERQKKFMWVLMNGKQVRVKRPELVDGLPVDEYLENVDDQIFLHENEMWCHKSLN